MLTIDFFVNLFLFFLIPCDIRLWFLVRHI